MDKQDKPASNHIWKVGDKARIVGNSNSHQFGIGEAVILVERRGDAWKTEYLDGHDCWFVREWDIEPLEDKPRICEVLGAEVGERFTYPGVIGEFYITENGTLVAVDDGGQETYKICVSTLINRHDRIIHPPRFTEDEVAAMRVLQRALEAIEITRDSYGDLEALCKGGDSVVLVKDMFPSIRPGTSVELAQILGAEET